MRLLAALGAGTMSAAERLDVDVAEMTVAELQEEMERHRCTSMHAVVALLGRRQEWVVSAYGEGHLVRAELTDYHLPAGTGGTFADAVADLLPKLPAWPEVR